VQAALTWPEHRTQARPGCRQFTWTHDYDADQEAVAFALIDEGMKHSTKPTASGSG
jgi:hypothetical protein